MKLRNFSLLIVGLFAGVLFLGVGDVSAQSCTFGDLKGTCKTDCDASSLSANFFTSYYEGESPVGCTIIQNCCIPRGQSLCSSIEAANTKVPVSLVGKFKCAKTCTSGPLSAYGGSIETCAAGQTCCSNPAPDPEGSPCLQAAEKKFNYNPEIHSSIETHCQLLNKDCETGYTLVGEDPVLCGQDNLKCCAKNPEGRSEGGGGTVKSGSPTTLFNPLGSGVTIYTIIQRVIQGVLGLVGAAALLVFVYAGVMWMTAGTSDRIQKAKDAMKYAVIGLFMIAFAYAISSFIVDSLVGTVGTQQEQAVEYATPPPPNPD